MSVEFIANQKFDGDKMRHYLNDELSVLHCHHYVSLFSQLADDAELLKGAKLLIESSEDTFYNILVKYFKDNNINTTEERQSISEQYFSFIGMGTVELKLSNNGGTAEMKHSHVDEGWIKKWKTREKPVNYIGQGYLAGAFSAIFDSELNTYEVEETQSIVSGSPTSKFVINKK